MGLFGGADVERTETSSTYRGAKRRTSEVILLDWDQMSSEAVQSGTITVRITDKTTGQEVERSIDFRGVAPEEQ